jgi:hypothetical protein
MSPEQPAKLTLAYPEPLRERLDVCLIQRAQFNQRQGPRNRIRCAPPCAEVRRGLGTAPQAWPETGFLGCCRGTIERDVLSSRGPRGTYRAAVNSRGLDAREEPSVKTNVTGAKGAIASGVIEVHGYMIAFLVSDVSRLSDSAILKKIMHPFFAGRWSTRVRRRGYRRAADSGERCGELRRTDMAKLFLDLRERALRCSSSFSRTAITFHRYHHR